MSIAVAIDCGGVAARRDDLAGIAHFRRRRPGAQADRRRIARSSDLAWIDAAAHADAVGDRNGAAHAADLQAVAVDAGVNAVARNAAVDDQAEAGAGPFGRTDRDCAGRADPQGSGASHRKHRGRAFLAVLDAVIVLVCVRRALSLGGMARMMPLRDVAFDRDRGTALKQVVGIELARIGSAAS